MLSHFNPLTSRARMVNVEHKVRTQRMARARGSIHISAELVSALRKGQLEKGDAFTTAKVAGILAAKQTGQLIPMCHPLPLDVVEIELELNEETCEIHIDATARTTAKTGVEMEAMIAVSVAALTFYDMCKAVDKGMVINTTYLVEKTGGKSGRYYAPIPRAPSNATT